MKKKDLRAERLRMREAEYRRFILRAAETSICRQGFHAVTMDDIAREAQFSKATLYRYFRSKGDILRGLLDDFFEDFFEKVSQVEALSLSPGRKLKRLIRLVLENSMRKSNISRIFLMDESFMKRAGMCMAGEKSASTGLDRRVLSLLRGFGPKMMATVSRILKDGIAAGEFRAVSVPQAVAYLMSVLDGFCHGRVWRTEERSVEEDVDFLYSFYLQGIARHDRVPRGGGR